MSSKPEELGQDGNKLASLAESQSRRIGADVDFGATATDVARLASSPWPRRNVTEVISLEPLGKQRRQAEPFASQPTAAGATQVIDVSCLAIQPNAIIEVELKQGSSAPRVLVPERLSCKLVATAEVAPTKASEFSPNQGQILSPTEAASSRRASSPKCEPMPAPAPRAIAGPKSPALTTILDAPLVRVAERGVQVQPARRGSTERAPSAVAKLGMLTRRYPVGVIGGVAVGAMTLGVFLVGAAQLLGLRSRTPVAVPVANVFLQAADVIKKPVEPSLGKAIGSAAPARPALDSTAPGAPNVSLDPPVAPAMAPNVATQPDPSVPLAVGHLFSGRLLEAEQAYRELAARHLEDPTYQALSRILARRNGPDCRPGNPMQKACPTVKP